MSKFATAGFLLLFSFNLFSSVEILCEKKALLDEEIHIEVVGLSPNQIVEIAANRTCGGQIQWRCSATFQADLNGEIRLAHQAPIKGCYEGIDPMGLFWSMEMGNIVPLKIQAEVDPDLDEEVDDWYISTDLKVLDGKFEIARKEIRRFIRKSDVEFVEVQEDGLIGELFIPRAEGSFPVVIVLTGSNGGIPGSTAPLLASHGMAAFALAYSGMEGLPPDVQDVPLEYFEKAFAWIKNQPRLNGKIALHGTSRGAELALLLGSMFPDVIERIVAVAPSSVVLSPDSWIYHGESVLPAAPFFVDLNYDYRSDHSTRDHPQSIKIHRERGLLLEKERYDAASLPVERIQCPILLISGGDDQMGPCCLYAQQILERLDRDKSKIKRTHLNYSDAGHLIAYPFHPRVNIVCNKDQWLNYGGTPLADELASRDSWKKTLEFLKEDQIK